MSEQFNPVTEPWSAGYDLVQNAEVHQYPEEEAMMDFEMFDALAAQFGQNFVGYIGGLHYQFKRERSVPSGAVAVPRDNHVNPDTLLIQR